LYKPSNIETQENIKIFKFLKIPKKENKKLLQKRGWKSAATYSERPTATSLSSINVSVISSLKSGGYCYFAENQSPQFVDLEFFMFD
jgi:hypothetical protein